MTQQDLNNYFLYALLLFSSPEVVTLSNFLKYYTICSIVNTVSTALFYPISGWITDITGNISGCVFISVNILQFITLLLQLLPYVFFVLGIDIGLNTGWIVLCVLWQLRQIVSLQASNSLWKIIKQVIEKEKSYNSLEQINKIGNIGDLCSDSIECTILVALTLLLLYYKASYDIVILYFMITIGGLNLVLLMWSSIFWNFVPEISLVENSNKITIKPWVWFSNSIKAFYNNQIAFHAFWHCIILGIYTVLIQYPMSLIEVESSDNTFINIFVLAALTNAAYFVGSVWYWLFIVKCSPHNFYKVWYPIGSILLLGSTLTLWFDVPTVVIYIMVSISQVVPYYLTYYDYYLFTEKYDEKYYGFVLGLYGIITTITTVGIQSLYLVTIPFIAYIITGIGLLLISMAYSWYISAITK